MGKQSKKSKKSKKGKKKKSKINKIDKDIAMDNSLMKLIGDIPEESEKEKYEKINTDPKYPTYQIHANKNDRFSVLQEVGEFSKTPHTLIEEIELNAGLHYQTLSCFHLSKDINNQTEIPMVRTRISINDGTKLNTFSHIIAMFHTFDHLKEKKELLKYVTKKDMKEYKIQLKGFFSIQLHIDKTKTKFILETFKEYPGNTQLLSLMAEHLMSKFVQDKIEENKTD